MRYEPIYFELHEIVCPDIFNKFGDTAWQFIDPRLLIVLDKLRERLNKPITINTWKEGGSQTQSGLRCVKCGIVKDKINAGELYMSAHMEGQAADFHVEGMIAEEVRQWIIKNQNILPYAVRLESGVSWVHLDVRDAGKQVTLFNP